MLNVFQSFVFYGTQMYFGGQAFVIILNALSWDFLNMPNTLPESAGITTTGLIGFVLFIILYFPVIYFVHPHQVQRFLEANLVISTATLLGIMAWAVNANGGPGSLIQKRALPTSQVQLSRVDAAFGMAQGIMSVAGTYTGGSERVSDWTRYARHQHAPTYAIAILPITVTLTAFIGIIATSATTDMFGSVQWNPMIMLQELQATQYTAACRAGTFFAGLGLLSVTVFVNYTQNCVSSGMDLAMLMPRYLSRRRGSIIFSILGILAQPWRFLSQAETFITVLSSFGVFMSPAAAILAMDFWIVRRLKWNIPDMYTQGGIYWYTFGLNWRAIVAYMLGMVFCLPGFIQAVGGANGPKVPEGWYRLFQVSYFYSYATSAVVFLALSFAFKPAGLGKQVDFELVDGHFQGVEKPDGVTGDEEKRAVQVTETPA